MDRKSESRVITAHLPVSLAEQIDEVAERLERSRGWIVKQALTTWLAQEIERDRFTREALADVDAGDVINHDAMRAWAESLFTDQPLPGPTGKS